MSIALHHVTRYRYDRAIRLGPQVVRLRPGLHCRIPIPSYSLTVEPVQHLLHWQQDPHGNWLARLLFPEKTMEFCIAVDLTANFEPINPFDFLVEPYAENWPFAFPADPHKELAAFVEAEPAGPRLQDLLGSIARQRRNTVEFLLELNRRLHRAIRYLVRAEPGVQSPEETLASGAGSCRDMAWLLVQILRHLGLPARFVSGYLIQLRDDPKTAVSKEAVERDRADLHAWVEVYLPGAGWIGIDASSGLLCAEAHLPLAAAPHYRSVAPVTGTVEPCNVSFSCDISVRRNANIDALSSASIDESVTTTAT